MKVSSVTYYGWRDNLQTVEKRIKYDYPKGNDVTVVENRSYSVPTYNQSAKVESIEKGKHIDILV